MVMEGIDFVARLGLERLRDWVIAGYDAAVLHDGMHPRAVLHPLRVADGAQTEDQYVVALLHDAIEDNIACMPDILVQPYWPITDHQRDAIFLLTRYVGEDGKEILSYNDYIDNIIASGNRLAMEVKVLDLLDNLNPYRFFNPKSPTHRDRYIRSLAKMSAALGV